MIRAGQKVVCVDASLPVLSHVIRWIFRMRWPLTEGTIYTAQRIAVVHSENVIELVEVNNMAFLDRCFRLSRFRPVVTRETNIGFAHEILKKVGGRAPALSQADRLVDK